MPSPLYRVLGIRPQPQTPVLPVEGDEDYAGMLSDADVSDMQDEDLNKQIADNAKLPRDPITNEPRGVVNLKSAYDTKQQGMSALRRTLGADRSKVKDQILLANNNAGNAMNLEKQRQSSAERIAAKNAELTNARIAAQQEFQAQQAALARDAINNRTAMSVGATDARARQTQAGQNERQLRQQAEVRAKALEAQAAKIGPLGRLLGHDKELMQQAAQIRSQALQGAGAAGHPDPEVAAAAQNFRTAYPNAGPDDIMGILQAHGGMSPEDMQALYTELVSQ